jgi:hypothetical protein
VLSGCVIRCNDRNTLTLSKAGTQHSQSPSRCLGSRRRGKSNMVFPSVSVRYRSLENNLDDLPNTWRLRLCDSVVGQLSRLATKSACAENGLDKTRTDALISQPEPAKSAASIFPILAGCHPARATDNIGHCNKFTCGARQVGHLDRNKPAWGWKQTWRIFRRQTEVPATALARRAGEREQGCDRLTCSRRQCEL